MSEAIGGVQLHLASFVDANHPPIRRNRQDPSRLESYASLAMIASVLIPCICQSITMGQFGDEAFEPETGLAPRIEDQSSFNPPTGVSADWISRRMAQYLLDFRS